MSSVQRCAPPTDQNSANRRTHATRGIEWLKETPAYSTEAQGETVTTKQGPAHKESTPGGLYGSLHSFQLG